MDSIFIGGFKLKKSWRFNDNGEEYDAYQVESKFAVNFDGAMTNAKIAFDRYGYTKVSRTCH